ncbi:hypothetical protein BIFGAL_03900 [Bifidobacterium gallicum DSM 20093 = LMG 11596]|uniref:Teichoic acid transporter n=1 Tax=Bifidobacterium gallicum DSM 20093 = LMG 11596 TaxID=561180 RepID=D1NVL1_9BIFI|nr:hypothetical protein BIFGAL_03900 [Bifidobacterium gallicum DSM 20093 = LMG 11596]
MQNTVGNIVEHMFRRNNPRGGSNMVADERVTHDSQDGSAAASIDTAVSNPAAPAEPSASATSSAAAAPAAPTTPATPATPSAQSPSAQPSSAQSPSAQSEAAPDSPSVPTVSKHPTPTIGETDISLADIEKRRSHPGVWVAGIIITLLALIAPYWYGRALAVTQTHMIIDHLSMLEPRGVAMVSWEATLLGFIGLGMMIIDRHKIAWFSLFTLCLVVEQFIAGLSLLKFNFWNSTYVIYGANARLANAANLGIIAAALGLAVFAVVWVGLLVCIKKTSPLNVLTRVWVSFLFFIVIELLALAVVLFGGLITTV